MENCKRNTHYFVEGFKLLDIEISYLALAVDWLQIHGLHLFWPACNKMLNPVASNRLARDS